MGGLALPKAKKDTMTKSNEELQKKLTDQPSRTEGPETNPRGVACGNCISASAGKAGSATAACLWGN